MAAVDIAGLRSFLCGEEIDGDLWDGRDGMEAFMAALLADRDWYRSRVDGPVAEDVKHAGVTWEHAEAWAAANGVSVDRRLKLPHAIREAASHADRLAWDALDEMAAMDE